MTSSAVTRAIAQGQGEARWFGDALTMIRIAEPGGELTVVEFLEDAGSETPPARSNKYDIYVLMLEGGVTWKVEGDTYVLGPGDSLFIPRGSRMEQKVGEGGCRWIGITTPGGFEDLVRGLSQPAEALTLPPAPGIWPDFDPAPLLEKHGMTPAR
jgi:quercetin dioxygenase-like cupin family protein